jgi:histidinol-phosphate aminotransferase
MNTILHLDRNENLYGPAPKCLHVLKNIGLNELSVYPRDFIRGVKSRLSEKLAEEFRVPEQQILLSEGSEDMLKQCVHCYVKPGVTILAPKQSWWYYQRVADEVGGTTINYSLTETKDSYEYDAGQILDLYRKHSPHVVLIASPNNPTGNVINEDNLQTLINEMERSVVVLDQAYWGFDGQDNETVASLVNRFDRLVVLRTFSKYFALAGARIGFALAGKGLTHLANFAARYLGYNRVSEALALAALDSAEYYKQIAENIRNDREKYYGLFSRFEGFQPYRSHANFILVKIPSELRSPLQQFLSDNNIALKFFEEKEFSSHIRITMGTAEQNEKLLEILQRFLEVWKTYGVPS